METASRVLLQNAEYDFSSCDELEDELSVLHSGFVIVDFSNVTFIDSSALTALINTLKRMRSKDESSSITLVHLKPGLRRLFELTALNQLFSIV